MECSEFAHEIDDLLRRAASLPAAYRPVFLDEACDGAEGLRQCVARVCPAPDLRPATGMPDIDDILLVLSALPVGERPPFVDVVAGDDAGLRERIALLSPGLDDVDDAFLREPVGVSGLPMPHAAATGTGPLQPGDGIDVYRIVRLLGEGGMGQVYLAERADGQFEQKVAIKVVRPEYSYGEVLDRFEHERRILAQLQHPNIARLYGGGRTERGLPYFVMEYVEGEPIDVYCDRRALDVRQRMTLFQTVCEAVQYAQRNLIVHRDLKPGNIMVSATGQVKLLDFGIAKLIAQGDGPHLPNLTVDRAPLTLRYAAPEQIDQKPVNAATDVYALGIILYELLTGRHAYELVEGGLVQANMDLIRYHIPTSPSGKVVRQNDTTMETLQTLCHNRGLEEPVRLRRLLSGDLDAIVMKALKKEQSKRYASAGALLQDVSRYLDRLPVSARSDTRRYRLTKFVQRYRIPVILGAVAFGGLVIGLVASLISADIARNERQQRELEASAANEAVAFVVNLFDGINPDNSQGTIVTFTDVVDKGREELGALKASPLGTAKIMVALGNVALFGGMYVPAESLFVNALVKLEGLAAPHGMSSESFGEPRFDASYGSSVSLFLQEHYPDAFAYARRAEAALPAILDPLTRSLRRINLKSHVAYMHYVQELNKPKPERSFAAADSLFAIALAEAEALAERRPVDREVTELLAETLRRIGSVRAAQDRYEESEARYHEAIRLRVDVLGQDAHPKTATAYNGLAKVLRYQGNLDESIRYLARADDIYRTAYGSRHNEVATVQYEFGVYYLAIGDSSKACGAFREAAAIWEDRLPEGHRSVALVREHLQRCR